MKEEQGNGRNGTIKNNIDLLCRLHVVEEEEEEEEKEEEKGKTSPGFSPSLSVLYCFSL